MKKENLIGLGFLGAAAYATFSSGSQIKYKSNSNLSDFPDFIKEDEAGALIFKNFKTYADLKIERDKYASKKIKPSLLLKLIGVNICAIVNPQLSKDKIDAKISMKNFLIDDGIIFQYKEKEMILAGFDSKVPYFVFDLEMIITNIYEGSEPIFDMIKDIESGTYEENDDE